MRARTLVALGLSTFGLACAPAISAAATGGAGMPSKTSPAKTSGDAAPAPQDQAGGAAFGAIPKLLRPTVPGDLGAIRDGIAYAPENAPLAVQQAIWAANTLRNKPYLHGGGLLESPLDSGSFMKWGERGRGQWITVYTNPGHAFVVIAGIRLDTSGAGESGPRWRIEARSTSGYRARHPEGF